MISAFAGILSFIFFSGFSSAEVVLRVQARLIELPKTPACGQTIVQVTTRYRLEKILSGHMPTQAGDTFFVVQACPELARGALRAIPGTALGLRVGQVHVLTLRPHRALANVMDRFTDDKNLRYQAINTDAGPEPPQIIVVVSGNGTAGQRIDFDAEAVTVGRSPDCDVLLRHPQVALLHLRIFVKNDRLTVEDMDTLVGTSINGKPITSPTIITHKDRIDIGPFSLQASLLPPKTDPSDDDSE